MAATNKVILKTVFSGIQPTGYIHLGNYLGAVKNWVHLQETTDFERYFCVVDYHSITQKFVGKHIAEAEADSKDFGSIQTSVLNREDKPEELTLKTAATLIACGIDPLKSTLFVQSHVSAHAEMMWLLSSLTPLSWVNKMIQFKEKKSKDDKHSSLSLYSYPVLMAADILLYQASLVPVGEDQTQHLELSKDISQRFNRLFGELFPEPGPTENNNECHRVMSLQDGSKKMSKSDVSRLACINLIDDPEMIRTKIKKAKTDSEGAITYTSKRPELANLLRIYAAIEGIDVNRTPQLFEGDNMFAFKEKLSDKLIDKICPIGERAMKLCADDEDQLLEILDTGARKAHQRAEQTLVQMKQQVGILRRNL